MDSKSQEVLNNILKKEIYELTESDIKFLKARRFYLTSTVVVKYQDIFEPDVEEDLVIKTQDKKEDTKQSDNISGMTYKELQKLAENLGFVRKGKGATKRDDLEKYVRSNIN